MQMQWNRRGAKAAEFAQVFIVLTFALISLRPLRLRGFMYLIPLRCCALGLKFRLDFSRSVFFGALHLKERHRCNPYSNG
jgi:hypothetical protein